MSKKSLILVISLVLALTVGLGGTLAYLTDRDAEVNVFTVGNVDIDLTEDFEQGAELIPGVNIDKRPTIINEGNNDAWVWMTWSIPAALDEEIQGTQEGSSDNIVHWNPLGATAEGYVTEARVNNAIAAGYLPKGTTAADILASNSTWNVFNSLGEGENFYTENIDGVDYNTYVLLYNKALEPGEETLPSIYNVYLDPHVDIDPEGNAYHVVNGEVTDLEWNVNEDGTPKILVAAYAIQKEGFESVEEAYAAYGVQWGDNGGVEFVVPVQAAEEADLLKGGNIVVKDTVNLTEAKTEIRENTTFTLGEDAVITGDRGNTSGADTFSALTVYDAKVFFEGEGTVENTEGYAITLRDEAADVTINGGTYIAETTAINVVKGTLKINGGYFEDTNEEDNGHYLINCIDANYRDGSAKVVITGGTFVNWNPADNTSEGAGTNFVPAGYKVETEVVGENTLYTVVAE